MCVIVDRISNLHNKLGMQLENNKRNYLSKCIYHNKIEDTYNQVTYNSNWSFKQDFIYLTQRANKLQYDMLNDGYTPIFITLTLPSEYHKYRKHILKKATKNRKEKYMLVKNTKYKGHSVNDGYSKLLEQFRYLYAKFKIGRKNIKGIKFIRVIEPHKNTTAHLHAIIYVKTIHLSKYKLFYNRFIERENIKEHKFEVLKRDKYSIVYLFKYISKTIEGDLFVKGWQHLNKINSLYSISNVGINRAMFKILSNYIEYDKNDIRPYITQILDKAYIEYRKYKPLIEHQNYDYLNLEREVLLNSENIYEYSVKKIGNPASDLVLHISDFYYINYDYVEKKSFTLDNLFLDDNPFSDTYDEYVTLDDDFYSYQNISENERLSKILLSAVLYDKDGYIKFNNSDYILSTI